MTELFHIAARAEWDAAAASGEYRMSTRDRTLAEEGFIHCSARHQLRAVAERHHGDADDLVLLTIDSGLLTVPVRYEARAPGADSYPHIYGPLPVSAVVDVVAVSRDADGQFVLPE